MYFHLLDSLARIHSVDVDAVGLGSYGKKVDPSSDKRAGSGYIARQIKVTSIPYYYFFSWTTYLFFSFFLSLLPSFYRLGLEIIKLQKLKQFQIWIY